LEISSKTNDQTDKIFKYKNLIENLNLLVDEKNKLEFNIKKLKEKIDEYETNNLLLLDEFDKVKNEINQTF
jgi:hypothetical protein